MIFEPRFRFFESADVSARRYAMNAIQVRATPRTLQRLPESDRHDGIELRLGPDNERWTFELYATDGRKMVRLPIEAEEGETFPEDVYTTEGALIDARSIKDAWKGKGERALRWDATRKVWTLRVGKVCTDLEAVDGVFPPCETLIEGPPRTGASVTLNVEYLNDLAKSLGAETLTLALAEHSPATSAVRVTGHSSEGPCEGEAVIMPIAENK